MADIRPDLEAAPYKMPNYLGKFLFPGLNRAVKAGTLYYSDVVADAAAQTSRTVGTAPTASVISSASTTWALTEAIKRKKIGESEIEQLGGLDAAQMKAARTAKRSVAATIESKVIAATFGDTAHITTADIGSSFLAALTTAKETVEDYAEGKVCIFGARKMISRLKRYDEVVERMTFPNALIGDPRDVRSISDQVLAGALNVDLVLAGPSTASASGWLGASSAYDGYIGVCVLPDGNIDPDEEVQFGRTIVKPAGSAGELFKVETFFSDDLKAQVCDVTAWFNVKALNKECCYILTGVDEENAVTTTTTSA